MDAAAIITKNLIKKIHLFSRFFKPGYTSGLFFIGSFHNKLEAGATEQGVLLKRKMS